MLQKNPLLPKEKERLKNFTRSITKLARKPILSRGNAFLMRQQMRAVLQMFGVTQPGKILVGEALEVMQDVWPFKERRLRKLVNGRRPRQ
jgi:hypothetical protein